MPLVLLVIFGSYSPSEIQKVTKMYLYMTGRPTARHEWNWGWTSNKPRKVTDSALRSTQHQHIDNNPHEMWRGIRTITDYKDSNQQISRAPTLLGTLDSFFCRLWPTWQQWACSPLTDQGAERAQPGEFHTWAQYTNKGCSTAAYPTHQGLFPLGGGTALTQTGWNTASSPELWNPSPHLLRHTPTYRQNLKLR